MYERQSIFNYGLAVDARKLARDGVINIIESNDFPDDAPIHEDGSTEYDPQKPLVYFAVELRDQRATDAWNAVLKTFDERRGAQ